MTVYWTSFSSMHEDGCALSIADPRVRGWLLLDNYTPTLAFTVMYLLIVWMGPKYMKNRPPYSCRALLVPYNLGLTLLSLYMFYEVSLSWRCLFEEVISLGFKDDPLWERTPNSDFLTQSRTVEPCLHVSENDWGIRNVLNSRKPYKKGEVTPCSADSCALQSFPCSSNKGLV